MDFSKRHRENELMDNPGVSSANLKRIYEDIDQANRLLGGDKGTLDAIDDLILDNPQKSYTVIDIGCGNGAILRKVCRFFRKRNLEVQLTGIDLNDSAIAIAKESSMDYPEIEYVTTDVLQKAASNFKADIVISTLTMHHIPEENIPLFLRQLTKMACMGVIINDLKRSRSAYYLFKLFSVIFIKTMIAKNDGLVSIRSGFTKKELLQYSKLLPDMDYEIRSKWAFRYVWVMQPKRLR